MNLNAEYPPLGTRWDRAQARAAYDATPPAERDGIFWTSLAANLRRTHDAVYRQLHVRWGWPAKRTPPQSRPRSSGAGYVYRCACGGWRHHRSARCMACYLGSRSKPSTTTTSAVADTDSGPRIASASSS